MSALPIVALPGLMCDERLWRPQAEALGAERPFISFALTPEPTIAALAEAALARIPAGRFALAGLSMGGYLAFEIVRRAPERVAGLALLDTSARPETPEATAMRRQAIAASAEHFEAGIDVLLPRLLHPSHLGDEAITGAVRAMSLGLGREAYVRQQEAIIGRADSRPTLAQIRCPTLVLCGREDLITPPAVHEEMQAGIAGARLEVIEHCGHLSTLERPAEVTAALRAWLARIDA